MYHLLLAQVASVYSIIMQIFIANCSLFANFFWDTLKICMFFKFARKKGFSVCLAQLKKTVFTSCDIIGCCWIGQIKHNQSAIHAAVDIMWRRTTHSRRRYRPKNGFALSQGSFITGWRNGIVEPLTIVNKDPRWLGQSLRLFTSYFFCFSTSFSYTSKCLTQSFQFEDDTR